MSESVSGISQAPLCLPIPEPASENTLLSGTHILPGTMSVHSKTSHNNVTLKEHQNKHQNSRTLAYIPYNISVFLIVFHL